MRRAATAAVAAGVALALLGSTPAAAEPGSPPPPPAPAPAPLPAPALLPEPGIPPAAELIPAISNVLAQAGSQPTGPLGLPDLSNYGTNLILGQNAQPALPGAPGVIVPDLRAFNPDYLVPLNAAPAAPGEGTPAPGIAPNEDIAGTGRIAFLRRLYEMYQAGDLRGALLGQQPPEQVVPVPAPPPPG